MVSNANTEAQSSSSPSQNTPPTPSAVSALDPIVIEQNLQLRFNYHSAATGEISMPCLPSMLDYSVSRLDRLFETIGHKLSEEKLGQLRDLVAAKIQDGFKASPHARLVVRYEPAKAPATGLDCSVATKVLSIADQYQSWIENREPPLFGGHPDAKVMATAETLGDPSTVRILDIGAGTGRNTLPLAQRGHSVDALELTPALAEILLKSAVEQSLPVRVIQGDILDPLVRMRAAHYKLAIVSEVITHFRDNDQVRLLFAKMCDVLQSGGLLLFNVFLAAEGYEPDNRVREMSQVAGSYIMTQQELNLALEDLPLDVVSDESVLDYEHAHLPQEAWPPTRWFVSWVSGHDVFPIQGSSLMQLRWILCRRI